jgi:hypothetical protein
MMPERRNCSLLDNASLNKESRCNGNAGEGQTLPRIDTRFRGNEY